MFELRFQWHQFAPGLTSGERWYLVVIDPLRSREFVGIHRHESGTDIRIWTMSSPGGRVAVTYAPSVAVATVRRHAERWAAHHLKAAIPREINADPRSGGGWKRRADVATRQRIAMYLSGFSPGPTRR